MQVTPRKTSDRKIRKENDDSKKAQDEKLKKGVYTVSTPREYSMGKTSTSDIYAQKNTVAAKAPRKVPGVSSSKNMSPMAGLLKSSASSVSLLGRTSERSDKTPLKNKPARNQYSAKSDGKALHSTTRNETPRKELFTNVTVNSPTVKRRLILNSACSTKEVTKKVSKSKEIGAGEPKIKDIKDLDVSKLKKSDEIKTERQRTKTRTLDESEVKVLTPEQVHNNAQMLNLSSKLSAKPKAFYVDLDDKQSKTANKEPSDEEEVSYEDDFESYESDFDSYHSEESEASAGGSQASSAGDTSERSEKHIDGSLKENDERELDSGNFELRDARSAKSKPAVMDDIMEDSETLPEHSRSMEENRRSLDEGFQDMSSSSSVRTGEAERPNFLDFTKSKRNKLRRKINERLTQRAKDLFNFISLHEMTFSLFEMQPISYDLYMATFGRSNYTQSGVQTFDDGITQEIQTDEVTVAQKWTQFPVKFSKHDISQNTKVVRKYSINSEDYFANVMFLTLRKLDDDAEKQIVTDENYQENPLRILFEQKDGVGSDKMLPYETYKTKLKSRDYSTPRLSKFLKKVESKVSHILSKNTGSKDFTDLEKSGKLPFSSGYVTITPKTIQNPMFSFLSYSKISAIFYSETKSNLLLTVHKNARGVDGKKSLLCLWDLSVAREPLKILQAIDNIVIGKFRGNTDGTFVAALEDGSIHLWDLSEEPSWRSDTASSEKSPELLEFESQQLTQMEKDREWNMKNGKAGVLQLAIVYGTDGAKICYQSEKGDGKKSVKDSPMIYAHIPCALQSCAYTSSAANMSSADSSECIVGLEFMASQVVSLQRIGIITIWSIIQEKKASNDIGKAFWSKIKLEKLQTINISEHIDISIQEHTNFNLNSAKRRLSQRKNEKPAKRDSSRPKTASKFDFDIDRPFSAASLRKKVLSVEINIPKSWENGIVCNDLRIVNLNNVNIFLVAKNNGEVLCCKRCLGVLRIERFSVASNTSSITCLDVSSEGIPYFLAATDTGTVNLCSLLENRVLLTLDCRNVPKAMEKCQSDHKGRFVSSATARSNSTDQLLRKLSVTSVVWSPVNHCCIFAILHDNTLLVFDLTHSDMAARSAIPDSAESMTYSQHTLALLTPKGDIQIHRLSNEEMNKEYLHLFNKYVALI